MKNKILLVEDDENLGFVTKDNLDNKGYEVTLCTDGELALQAYANQSFDLCILDVMLPKVDGFQVAREIRKTNKNIPILFLTAKSLQEDKLIGFELGGDDYLTKPFSIEELVFRIEVFLKRSERVESTIEADFGAFTLNMDSYSIESSDVTQKLTRREAEILQYLLARKNSLVKREQILIALWGDDDYFKGRSLDVFISKLRKYLKSDPTVDIENYHGVGFKLKTQEW